MARWYALIVVFLLAGCLEQSHSPEVSALERDIESLRTEVASLKLAKASLEMDDMYEDWEEIAYLKPGDTGWSPIRMNLGTLTVQIADVKPYANGAKVSLQFGNPLATTIGGLKAQIEWGTLDGAGNPNNDAAKSKEASFNEQLKSGTWTIVPLVLEGVPASELGFVRVRNVKYSTIYLNGK